MKNIIVITLFMALLCACSTTKKSSSEQQTVTIKFNADSAYLFCQQQCDFGPRTMNSEAHARCAQWIADKFRQYGCDVELQQADLKGYDGTLLKSTNIIAHSTSSTGKPRIMICAHWDSRPWADNDPDEANWNFWCRCHA